MRCELGVDGFHPQDQWRSGACTASTHYWQCGLVYSLCQGFLQCFWGVLLCHTALSVLWTELGQVVPQHPHKLLSLGVQTDPVRRELLVTEVDRMVSLHVMTGESPEGDDAAWRKLLEGDFLHKLRAASRCYPSMLHHRALLQLHTQTTRPDSIRHISPPSPPQEAQQYSPECAPLIQRCIQACH